MPDPDTSSDYWKLNREYLKRCKEAAKMTVEGVDYSPEGIDALRGELIEMRDALMKGWPETIDATVVLTHAIALLSAYRDVQKDIAEGKLHPRVVRTDSPGGEHTAEWYRGDTRITARWKDGE